MIKLLLLAFILVAVSFVFLGINIFLFKRKFPETDVGNNKDMRRMGLSCPRCDEMRYHKTAAKPFKINPLKLKPDWSAPDNMVKTFFEI